MKYQHACFTDDEPSRRSYPPARSFIKWDTGGSDTYRSVVSHYLRGADGVILCFDVTRKVKSRIAWIRPCSCYLCQVPPECHLVVTKHPQVDMNTNISPLSVNID